MTPRRIGLIFGLAALVISGVRMASAQGQRYNDLQGVFQSEGRQRIWFNTACIPGSWTLIISSDTISHSTFMMSISSNTSSVCLSSSAAAGGCSATTQGPELAPNSWLTDYSHGEWYCESSAGTQYVKGYRTRDKGDYGNIGATGAQ
jgi:hypothetical protein